jgi:predicted ester cyclase
MSEENKRLVRQVYEDIPSERKVDLVDQVFSADYVGHDPTAQPEEVRGREGFEEQTLGYRSVFPDLRFTIDSMVAEGDEVFVRWTARGTHQGSMAGESPTGNRIEVTASAAGESRRDRFTSTGASSTSCACYALSVRSLSPPVLCRALQTGSSVSSTLEETRLDNPMRPIYGP